MTPLDMAYRTAMDERISELLRYRRWWRENRWADWPTIRHDLEVELRALVTLARQARKAARLVEDAMEAAYKAEFDDRGNHYIFPEGVVEGLPEFNGAFK